MERSLVTLLTVPPLGGGGMAQASIFDRLFPYLVWGVLLLGVCALAGVALRRIYRPRLRTMPHRVRRNLPTSGDRIDR